MSRTCKVVHLLAVGMWFGSVAFFSFFTALPIISGMQELATTKDNWLHLSTKEEGIRVAGEALSRVFPIYFPVQVVCGALAVLTACCFLKAGCGVHKLRLAALVVALSLALANLLVLSPKVHELRQKRYDADSIVAKQADDDFQAWHSYSLWTDMAGLLLVATALGMASALPREDEVCRV